MYCFKTKAACGNCKLNNLEENKKQSAEIKEEERWTLRGEIHLPPRNDLGTFQFYKLTVKDSWSANEDRKQSVMIIWNESDSDTRIWLWAKKMIRWQKWRMNETDKELRQSCKACVRTGIVKITLMGEFCRWITRLSVFTRHMMANGHWRIRREVIFLSAHAIWPKIHEEKLFAITQWSCRLWTTVHCLNTKKHIKDCQRASFR